MLLTCRDAVASRGRFEVGPFSLQVDKGECVALLGENGAGKSTLLAALMGEVSLRRGEIVLGDRNVTDWSVKERARQYTFVPQNENTPVGFTVLEAVLIGRTPYVEGLRDRAVDTDLARSALEQVGLAGRADDRYDQLSGGQIQRVRLARSLCQQAPLILLDEPTSQIDAGSRNGLLSLIENLKEDGHGLVVATHDINFALRCADRVLTLKDGSVLASVTTDDLASDHLSEAFGVAYQEVLLGRGRAFIEA